MAIYRTLGSVLAVSFAALFLLGAERGEREEAAVFPRLLLRDVVVNNTDRNLKNTDMFLNSEPGIAVNPLDPRKIVISAFSGAWTTEGNAIFAHAPLWYSTNGGGLWTKEFTIPAPPGVARGAVTHSPCDQTFEYGWNGVLYGTFLLSGSGAEGSNGANCSSLGATDSDDAGSKDGESDSIYTGGMTDPANAATWRWNVVNGKTQPTNQMGADQPWIAVNRDPWEREREKVYVGYQADSSMQVAVAEARLPLDFVIDRQSGLRMLSGANPGQRIAGDQRTGAIYAVHEEAASTQCESGKAISYLLNRSTDGGQSWELNGSADGVSVAEVCSHQDLFFNLFGELEPNTITGGVNSLRGGIDAIAVDSPSGAVYVVYGEYDASANRDRIRIVKITSTPDGQVRVHAPHYVSGPEHQSALPAVAVAANGAVGVLYDTADALQEETLRPYFSVHMALSRNEGASFTDVVAQRFLFPDNAPSGNSGPRPLGDYQQLKSEGNTFYGVFSGDGEPFGRPFHKIDPIFVRTSAESFASWGR